MEYRYLGRSGFRVPVLSFGTGTFGGEGKLFGAWGNTDVAGATRLVDVCLDAGVNLFDTADIYSGGASESILGSDDGLPIIRSLVESAARAAAGERPLALVAAR